MGRNARLKSLGHQMHLAAGEEEQEDCSQSPLLANFLYAARSRWLLRLSQRCEHSVAFFVMSIVKTRLHHLGDAGANQGPHSHLPKERGPLLSDDHLQ